MARICPTIESVTHLQTVAVHTTVQCGLGSNGLLSGDLRPQMCNKCHISTLNTFIVYIAVVLIILVTLYNAIINYSHWSQWQ